MEILGLIDSLEAALLDGFKIPLTKKLVINEEQILVLVDKIRLVAQGGSDFAKKAIDKDRLHIEEQPERAQTSTAQELPTISPDVPMEKGKAAEIIQQAYQIAKEVREGADKYADEVLSNLELSSTRVLRTIKAGRERLQSTVQGENKSNTDV